MDPGSRGEAGWRETAARVSERIDRRGVLRVVGFVGIASLGSCLESWDNFQRDVDNLDVGGDPNGDAVMHDDDPVRRESGEGPRRSGAGGDDGPEARASAREENGASPVGWSDR